MSPTKLRMGIVIALLTVIVAAPVVIQHRVIRELCEENVSLRKQIEQLAQSAKETQDLSNRLIQASISQSRPNDPSGELLRLRGEAGVLRRQLQESQQLMSAQSSSGPRDSSATSAPPEEISRKMEALRSRGQAGYVRLKTLTDQLQDAPDRDALAQAILASGLRDNHLSSLLEQRGVAVQQLEALQKDRHSQDPQIEDSSNQVADLTSKIGARSGGILLGLKAKTETIRALLEGLQSETDSGREESMERLESILNSPD